MTPSQSVRRDGVDFEHFFHDNRQVWRAKKVIPCPPPIGPVPTYLFPRVIEAYGESLQEAEENLKKKLK